MKGKKLFGLCPVILKFYCFLLFILLHSLSSFAQTFTLAGKIVDSQGTPLEGANIRLLKSDSTFISGGVSSEKGFFKFELLAPQKYLLKITFVGYDVKFVKAEMIDQNVFLRQIILAVKETDMKGIVVKGEAKMAEQKGDTTQYNAGAFKTNPDANAEDLVTKLPGVSSEDGKLKSGGEDIRQVLVDGKPFFGDDPNAVLKNLPAEVIDKIQIFDRKSDQSQLTGFDDGNTSKTINIVTKVQFRNGIFGKVNGGYGTEQRYKASGSVNFFKDKRRFTVLANSNNVYEQNFSSEDLLGVMANSSGGGRRSGGSSSGSPGRSSGSSLGGSSNSAQNFLVDQKNGISTTQALGLNFANSWKKVDFSGSYFLNYSDNLSLSNLHRLFIRKENQGLAYDENNNSVSQNTNHRLNFKYEWKINPKRSFIFQPKISWQLNDGRSQTNGLNTMESQPLSSIANLYKTGLEGWNVSAPLLYRHSFLKKGRSFSLNVTPGFSTSKGKSDLYYENLIFGDTSSGKPIVQASDLYKPGLQFAGTLAYTEPIDSNSQLLFSYTQFYNRFDSKKQTWNTLDPSNAFLDSSLSNTFNTNYFSQSLGLGYKFRNTLWNANGGLNFQKADLKNIQQFPSDFNLHKTFFSILPNASFQYKFNAQQNIKLNYNSSNNAPSADQLQEVINNKNPLILSTGNPKLKQDFQNNVYLRFSSINTTKNTVFFALLAGSLAKNYIVNSTFIARADTFLTPSILLARGSQIAQPINMDGYYTVRSFVNYSFPLSRIQSKLNLNMSGSVNRTPALINQQNNFANTSTAGVGVSLTSNISTEWDFTLSTNTSYSIISNTLQKQLNSEFLNQNTRFKIQANPWKGLVLQSDISHQFYSGLSANFNQNFLLWNAGLGYKFLKNKHAELRLIVYDLMKQNNSISRNTAETYYEDVQTTVLQRYFMMTFTYNLRLFKNSRPGHSTP